MVGKGIYGMDECWKSEAVIYWSLSTKVPADLGYYDLRVPEVRELQASLAKEAGIYGFCYYHIGW